MLSPLFALSFICLNKQHRLLFEFQYSRNHKVQNLFFFSRSNSFFLHDFGIMPTKIVDKCETFPNKGNFEVSFTSLLKNFPLDPTPYSQNKHSQLDQRLTNTLLSICLCVCVYFFLYNNDIVYQHGLQLKQFGTSPIARNPIA